MVSILRRSADPRAFLVCIRAGARSRHREWFKPERPRSWDLMLSCFEPLADGSGGEAEILVAGGLSKFSSVKAIHDAAPELFAAYRAILFLDDDILIDFAGLDLLFATFVRAKLELAQPALTHDSYHSWTVTLACPSFYLRYTNFVEIMMPIFSRAAFLACVESFAQSISGYGLDFVWPMLLGYPRDRIAVIDGVTATHTRPIDRTGGRFYDFLRSVGIDPEDEWDRLCLHYGITPQRQEILGVVTKTRQGVVRVIFEPPQAEP